MRVMNAANIEGLACIGIGVIVTVVLLWATTSCPFFVGVG